MRKQIQEKLSNNIEINLLHSEINHPNIDIIIIYYETLKFS